ncbi:MAG TPA: sigma-54-dependent Fis family transcriptional regulator [Planctomycetes bacterium]|nr:sigma-54-dependent Fis family transcriptional regulator [Planctomycetota bacterium]
MKRTRILVVDDEEGLLEVVEDTLEDLPGLEIRLCSKSGEAAALLEEESFDLLISDIRMPGKDGIELLRIGKAVNPDLSVLMMTAFPSVESAVESMKLGATDYITKPFLPEDLKATVMRILEQRELKVANRFLRRQVEKQYRFRKMLGESPRMRELFALIQKVAAVDLDVLILGDTGTGKELVARSIHGASARAERPFVPVDCGAIPESLLESEFFGHEKGAFTGAAGRNIGLVELAEGGTFFLDEVAELPLPLQAKLLRLLQERRFRRLGGRKEIAVDLRILAATNRDLGKEVKAGRFREDLYFRLNVVELQIPSLRERKEDIPLLARHFLSEFSRDMGKGPKRLGPDVMEIFERYDWPGNVRQLQNVIKRLVALSEGEEIPVDLLPDEFALLGAVETSLEGASFFQSRKERIAEFEREYLASLLEKNGGDVSRSAQEAEIPRGTMYRLMKKHGIDPERFRHREG